jgi:ATP-dependent Clp protease ATP-binding subunit ClpA
MGTEHLLLAIIALGQGTAVTMLGTMGVDLEKARAQVEKIVGSGPAEKGHGPITYTPQVKQVLCFAAKEAKAFNHTYVGTEHILLALLREDDGVAGGVLKELGLDLEAIRKCILQELVSSFSPEERFELETSQFSQSHPDTIDISKHYDLYCKEGEQDVVYRNALLKGIKRLFKKTAYDAFFEYVELEQANGQTIFLARSSVIKFCEHGTTPGGEIIPKSKP